MGNLSGFEALSAGGVMDATHLYDAEVGAAVRALVVESLKVAEHAETAELFPMGDVIGSKRRREVDGHLPFLSISDGWNLQTELGLRIPNPQYPESQSALIAIQVSDIPGADQPDGAGVLSRVNELGHEVGQMAISRARAVPELSEVAHDLNYYETRVVLNTGNTSRFAPKILRPVLIDPHTDGSVVTWSMFSSQRGLQVHEGEEYVYPNTGSYFLAGRKAGEGIKPTLHRVIREDSAEGRTSDMDRLSVPRVAVVAFLKSGK